MTQPASDPDALVLVRGLVVDVKDLALKEIEAAKLHARRELDDIQRRLLFGVGAAGLALLVAALVAIASALALARSLDLSLEAALLIVASLPLVLAAALFAGLRRRKNVKHDH